MTRPFVAGDNIGTVCGCANCVDAGVGQERMRKVPDGQGGSRWIHAEELRRWLDARNQLRRQFGTALSGKSINPEGRRAKPSRRDEESPE